MAKPTVRVPVWSSTGTKTDPGGAREASGWSIAEKPPAYWVNWVWNAIGQWVSWNSRAASCSYAGFWELGSSPTVAWESGDTVTFDNTSGAPYSMWCNFANGVANTTNNSVVIMSSSDSYNYSITANWNTTTRLLVGSRALTDGSQQEVTTSSTLPRLRIVIFE